MIRITTLNIIWKPLKGIIRTASSQPITKLIREFPQTQCTQLDNGLIVATEERDSCNTCIGLFVNAGARYESPSDNGKAHFFEHLVYKGTTSTSKTNLEELISKSGAKFKCWTTRELCAYFVHCLSEDISTAMKILFDSVYCNAFSQSEIDIQRNLVYEEMKRHDNTIKDVMFDYLHSTAFQGTPLSQTVMGPSANLCNYTAESISKHVCHHIVPRKTVLAAVGCVKHEQMVCFGNSSFLKTYPVRPASSGACRYTGSEINYRDDSLQLAHVAVAVEGPEYRSKDRLVLQLAAIVLGAWDNSQPGGINHLNRAARAASSGLAHSYKPFHFFYTDIGLWGTQFVSPKLEVDNMLSIIQDEWMRLCNVITDRELIAPKREFKSKLLTKVLSTTRSCNEIGEMVMYLGYRPSLEERFAAIDAIDAKQMREVCSKYLYDKCPVVVSMGSTECMSDYTRVRAGMYWLRL